MRTHLANRAIVSFALPFGSVVGTLAGIFVHSLIASLHYEWAGPIPTRYAILSIGTLVILPVLAISGLAALAGQMMRTGLQVAGSGAIALALAFAVSLALELPKSPPGIFWVAFPILGTAGFVGAIVTAAAIKRFEG